MSQPPRSFPHSSAPLARPITIPGVLAVLAFFGCAFLLLPLAALATRVSWDTLGNKLLEPATETLLEITLRSALYATIITVLIGVPMAIMLQRLRRGSQLVRILILLPLAMPPVVAGLSLTALLGRRGITAPILNALELQFAFAFAGVVVAHIFIALPFVVITVDAALRQIDREVFDSAAGIGMSPWQVLWRITLPTLRPAIVTGTGLAFVRSLGEFGTTLTFAGSLPGTTRTMPIGIYLARETDPTDAYNLAAILILLALLVLLSTGIFAMRRIPKPVARTITDLDTDALRDLCAPTHPAPDITINGVTFRSGQVTALVGPNGSGKTTLLGRIGGRLTGGQAAQVALVRGLAARPAVLLLDEPLAAVDSAAAHRWRTLLRAITPGRTTILVSHDPLEVASISKNIAVLDRGEVTAHDDASTIFRIPPNPVVATFTGRNRLMGTVHTTGKEFVTLHLDDVDHPSPITVTGIPDGPLCEGDQAIAVVEPLSLTLQLPEQVSEESARNHWPGRITSIEAHYNSGVGTNVIVDVGGTPVLCLVTAQSVTDLHLDVGSEVIISAKALNVMIFPQL